jgi:hypothetical protein
MCPARRSDELACLKDALCMLNVMLLINSELIHVGSATQTSRAWHICTCLTIPMDSFKASLSHIWLT